MDDMDGLDGFGVLHRWTKAVVVLSAVGGVAALIAGILYLNDEYTNRGWGLVGLSLAALVFAGVSLWALKAAEKAQEPKRPLEPKPAKEPKPALEPKKPLPPKKPLTPKEQAAADKAVADKAVADKAVADKAAADGGAAGDAPR